MNLSDYTLTKNGKALDLTAKEFEILKLLMQNPKKYIPKGSFMLLCGTTVTWEMKMQ